jgi:site-specific recombinase XerD
MDVFDKYFTEAEERKLFATIKRVKGDLAERDYCWIRLARLTGIRLSPLSHLTVGDAIIAINTQYLEIGEFNKNKKKQSIFMVAESIKLLKKLVQLSRKISVDSELDEFERPLIVSRKHGRMRRRGFQRRFEFWISEAGLPRGTIHWLRHTFAKRIIQRNNNSTNALLAAQKLLGHTEIRTTTIYTSPDKESIKEMMANAS